jgi:ketosteroid isomerase-like protein
VASALELTRRNIERWNAGDVEALVADCDPDVVVRPEPGLQVIEGIAHGQEAALRFFNAIRDNMGLGPMTVLSEDDFGTWCMMRTRQAIRSPSGIESDWDWTVILTARQGRIVMIEFFVDDGVARQAVGLG